MRRVAAWALIACLAAGLVGCRGRQPVFLDRDDVQTSYKLEHVELLGPVEGTSERRRLLFLSFGLPKSFLEAEQEARLLAVYGDRLRADILVAPHHGSMTSSTPEFIDAVSPSQVIFTAGYLNR